MQIDLLSDDVLRLSEAAKILPRGRHGKKIHVSTLWRWACQGVRGVRLETVRMGGVIYTSKEALQRFFAQLDSPQIQPPKDSANRQRETNRVKQRLKEEKLLS